MHRPKNSSSEPIADDIKYCSGLTTVKFLTPGIVKETTCVVQTSDDIGRTETAVN